MKECKRYLEFAPVSREGYCEDCEIEMIWLNCGFTSKEPSEEETS